MKFFNFDCKGNDSIIQKEKVYKDVIEDFIATEKKISLFLLLLIK